MTPSLSDKVKQFQKQAKQLSGPFTGEKLVFRFKLISEEVKELIKEADKLAWVCDQNDIPYEEQRVHQEMMLKELVDCVYVLIGTAVAFNWDFDKAFQLVHIANISKLIGDVERDKAGKILKSDTYIKPNLGECI